MENLSLYELNHIIRKALDTSLERSYWVVAEIGELRLNQNGHCYLELVEKAEEKVIAKTRATIWSYTYRNLSAWFQGITGQPLKAGLKILCNVVVQFHELYGLSVNIKDIDAKFTLGERAKRKAEIIDSLVADGIYDMNRELALPVVPQRLAVISSPTAAGFEDFVQQLTNNQHGYQFKIQLFKATMQGENASNSIINAMHRIHNQPDNFDVMIIIRGGGSQLDLDCFDDYELAAHIAQFPIPVITGIGHERDETIADLVAHTKMKTPTAVAEFIISGARSFEEKIEQNYALIHQYVNNRLQLHNQTLDSMSYRLKSVTRELLSDHEFQLRSLQEGIKNTARNLIKYNNQQLEFFSKTIDLIKPENVLKRGYSITTYNNKILKKGMVERGSDIKTETSEEIIYSTVQSRKEKKL